MTNKLAAVVSRSAFEYCGDELCRRFGTVFALPPEESLCFPVHDHPDMTHSIINSRFICHRAYYAQPDARKTIDYICNFASLELVLSDCERNEKYPLDCAFNALVTEKHLLCGTFFASNEVISTAKSAGLEIIHIKQGYGACSAVFAGGHVVTGDSGIARVCENHGIPVFTMPPGGIKLEPYNTGFIGGACGYSDSKLYLYGSLDGYSNGEQLSGFCRMHSIEIICLAGGALRDFGGIKIIKSK